MSYDVDIAFKTRWDAKSLGNSITGGIYRGRVPESTSMPYAIYDDVSADVPSRSRSSNYRTKDAQIRVYADDDAECATLAKAIEAAFDNAENASSDPMSISGNNGVLISSEITQPHTITAESDEVYMALIQITFTYATARNLAPA